MSGRQNNRRPKSMGLDLRYQVQIPAGPLVSCVTWAKCFKTSSTSFIFSTYTVEMVIIPSSLGYGEGELTFVKHLGQRLHVVWTSLLLTGLPLYFHFLEFFLSPLQRMQACCSIPSYCHLTYPLNPLLCASQSSVFHSNLLFQVASIPEHSFYLPTVSDFLFPTISKNCTGSLIKCKVQFMNMTNQRGTQMQDCYYHAIMHWFFFSELPAQQVKNPPANAGDSRDSGLIPGSGRPPGEGNDNPLQYSCLGNVMDRGAWWVTVHGVTKSQTRLSTCTHT